jgi:serine/threonine protein kinase
MPAEEVVNWHRSGKPAALDGHRLRPRPAKAMPDTPLTVQRGQADSLFCREQAGRDLILKKFNPGRDPGIDYLKAIGPLLPPHRGFTCGTGRRVLEARDVKNERACYYTRPFQQWVDGTVLMPKIDGFTWASVADEVRTGRLLVKPWQRLALCHSLSELARELEAWQCAHRDFSCGNAMLQPRSCRVELIDFDALYHPSLAMPPATTIGTEGYIAPFVWRSGEPNVKLTWCPHADRFALAILNIEFLLLNTGDEIQNDGGLFPQAELRARHGPRLRAVMRRLQSDYPEARKLLEVAINSRDYDECPSPEAWLRFCDGMRQGSPPALDSLALVWSGCPTSAVHQDKPSSMTGSTLRLADLLWEPITLPSRHAPVVVGLPPDPWSMKS